MSEMLPQELICIPSRLTITSAYPGKPWEHVFSAPDAALESKESFDKWSKGAVNHCFYSAYEGINPTARISKDNKVFAQRAVIADYDVAGGKHITPEEIGALKQALPDHLLPTFAHPTMRGGARLVWLFEKPVPAGLEQFRKLFAEVTSKQLRLNKLLPGFDLGAFQNASLTYDVWKDWFRMGDPLLATLTEQWCFEAAEKFRIVEKEFDGVEIPMDEVAKEVDVRYPGRWNGPFEEGRRGVVFFDTTSVNPTAAVVTSKGMVCFGQTKMFYNWEEILGKAFVEKFVQDKVGTIVADTFFDGKNYWYGESRSRYVMNNKENLMLRLRAEGLSTDRPRGGKGVSEVERALDYINQHKRVDKVAPLVFVKSRFTDESGVRTLNVSYLEPIQPAEEPQVWGLDGRFPWLSELLDTMFDAHQLERFLAWWQWYYMGALTGKPNKGHAVFLAGPVQGGKTFLTNCVLAPSMGGHYPATKFLLGETPFNKGPSELSLWTVDDAAPAAQEHSMAKFAERIKQLVVNGSFEMRAMYRDGVDINWSGRRLAITLNLDPVSLRMLIPLDTATEDKVMFFKTTESKVKFSPVPEDNNQRAKAELPYLLRWLADWVPSPGILTGDRLYVRGFIHPELRGGSLSAHGVYDFLQVIDKWFERRRQEDKPEDVWSGKAVDLLSSMTADDIIKELLRGETVHKTGRKLGQLASMQGSRVTKTSEHNSDGGAALWKIVAPWVNAEPSQVSEST